MSKVVFDISMSLDGFVTAANRRPDEPMGDGGERLHDWALAGSGDDREMLQAWRGGLRGVHRRPADVRRLTAMVGTGRPHR